MLDPTTHAVLLADRKGAELDPLNQFFPVALLPIGGKSPIEFWLETIYEMNIRKATVIVSSHISMIRERLADGTFWGIELEFLPSTGEDSVKNIVSRSSGQLPERFWLARADTMPSYDSNDQLRYFIEVDQNDPASIEASCQLDWPALTASVSDDASLLRRFSDISSVTRQVLSSDNPRFRPRGIEAEKNKWLATPHFRRTRLHANDASVYVGRESMVHRDVQLSGDLFIESRSYVDQGATLENAYIFPDTYVGQHVSVKNALVCGSFLIDLEHNVAQQVSDPALICHVEPASALMPTEFRERVVAACLIVLSAILVFLLLLVTREKSGPLLQKEVHASNRSSRRYPLPFDLLTFNSRIGWVSRWPRLVNVLNGDLKLFGSPIEKLGSQAPVLDLPLCQGLYQPKDLFINHTFDDNEVQLWGLELASEKAGYRLLFKRVIICLFNYLVHSDRKISDQIR